MECCSLIWPLSFVFSSNAKLVKNFDDSSKVNLFCLALCLFSGILCSICCVLSMMFAHGAGNYIFVLFDNFSGNVPLLIIAFCECVGVAYIYGLGRCDFILLLTFFFNRQRGIELIGADVTNYCRTLLVAFILIYICLPGYRMYIQVCRRHPADDWKEAPFVLALLLEVSQSRGHDPHSSGKLGQDLL